MNRTVAIKMLAQQVSNDSELKKRFEREAQAVAALNHPHICVLHDIGCHEGIDYLVKMRAELMGHGPEINQSVYTKVIPESLRNAVANVASELFANCSQSPKWVN